MISTATRAALEGLIDYAGLFPPAALAMVPALEEFVRVRESGDAWMLQRFIVPSSRIHELRAGYRFDTPLALSVTVDVPRDAAVWFDATRTRIGSLQAEFPGDTSASLCALEVPLPPLRRSRDSYDATVGQFAAIASTASLRGIPTYIEPPLDDRWVEMLPGAMASLARHRFGAKIRCGGAVASAFPSVEELAHFVREAVDADVPFKATAGLHHPVRRRDPESGFVMHGFLNLLAATLVARHALPAGTVEAAIAEEGVDAFAFEGDSFRWREHSFDVSAITAARKEGFVAYGSCSFVEPLEDLREMGIVAASP